jgi:Zinc carboxypeptidase
VTVSLPADDVLAHPPGAPGGAGWRLLGRSRDGREIHGFSAGSGPLSVSLIAGCHADEPVGPATLERLAAYLAALPAEAPALAAARWRLVPHVNPDGEAANASWSRLPAPEEGYDLAAYLAGAVREPPGDDVEFGFPRGEDDAGARPENRAVAAFLAAGAPLHLHGSFHGMGFGAGPWFLLEAGWVERTRPLRETLRRRVGAAGYPLHEVDRGGEKGFWRIDAGFTTRPDSGAMRDFFLARGEPETAALFRPSSMEYARGLGGDPLTFVSEMPLFLYPAGGDAGGEPPLPTRPEATRRFAAWARGVGTRQGAEALRRRAAELGIRPLPVGDQMRLQLALLEEALRTVWAYSLPSPRPAT